MMLYRYTGRGFGGKGRHEAGKVWADSRDEAIARLRASDIVLETLEGKLVPSDYTVSPEVEMAAKKKLNAPLHKVCEEGDVARVKALIAEGADLEARNLRGQTPLDIAVEQQNAKIVKVLVEAGANSGAESPAGGTIRDYAGRLESRNVLELLVRHSQSGKRGGSKRRWWQFWR